MSWLQSTTASVQVLAGVQLRDEWLLDGKNHNPSLSYDRSHMQTDIRKQPERTKKFISYDAVKISRGTMSVHMAQQCTHS